MDQQHLFARIMKRNNFYAKMLFIPYRITQIPTKMVSITASEYCVISNPVKRNEEGNILEEHGQAMLDFGEEEYRFAQPPFPLYPGEKIKSEVIKMDVLSTDEALLLTAIVGFTDSDETERVAGDKWLFKGPGKSISAKTIIK